jgi:CRISPR/Cas system CSM-associated protein Csm3 (group 7 of RAMP superfamily)
VVALDGQGRPVLRGTAVAGVLRAAYEECGKDASLWFGSQPAERKTWNPSRVVIEDAVFGLKASDLRETVHNAHNRHTGAVHPGALFSEQRVPHGAKTTLTLKLSADSDRNEADEFLGVLLDIFQGGLHFGGSVARGMGRAVLDGPARFAAYNMGEPESAAAYLDAMMAIRAGNEPEGMTDRHPAEALSLKTFSLQAKLVIPRGQDILIAEGADMFPMQRTLAGGSSRWIIPGSTLRGHFRAWFTRLAARDGKPVFDSSERYLDKRAKNTEKQKDLDEAGWLGKKKNPDWAADPSLVKCPVARLFGSLYAAGRIHIGDAVSLQPVVPKATQKRMHVAIDRFSGGANEGALFENWVLTSECGYEFPCTISIIDPVDDEIKYLAQTLKALDLGIIRIGSSKASGCIRVRSREITEGTEHHQAIFNNNFKQEI